MNFVLINTILFLFLLSLLLSVYVIIKRVQLDQKNTRFKKLEQKWEKLLFVYLTDAHELSVINISVKLHEADFLKFLLRFFEILDGDEITKLVELYHKLNLDQYIEEMKESKINEIKNDGYYLYTHINHFIKPSSNDSFKELFVETIDSSFSINRRLLMVLTKYEGSIESDLTDLLTSDISDEQKSILVEVLLLKQIYQFDDILLFLLETTNNYQLKFTILTYFTQSLNSCCTEMAESYLKCESSPTLILYVLKYLDSIGQLSEKQCLRIFLNIEDLYVREELLTLLGTFNFSFTPNAVSEGVIQQEFLDCLEERYKLIA